MNAAIIRDLYAHHDWANERVWSCTARLSADQRHAPNDYSIGSVFDQWYHLVYWEFYQFQMMRTGEMPPRHYQERRQNVTTWDALSAFKDHTFAQRRADLDALRDEQLTEPTVLGPLRWQILLQMYGHAIDHRAQILAALFQLGAATCEQSYMSYLREMGQIQPRR